MKLAILRQAIVQAYWEGQAWTIVNTKPQTHSSVHLDGAESINAEVIA